jgi:hypothetical protein
MLRKTLWVTCCVAFLGSAGFAMDGSPKSCCDKKDAPAAAPAKMRCALTGKVVDKCCCVQKKGKTHCTLAKKDVEKCCCSPVEEGAQKQQTKQG